MKALPDRNMISTTTTIEGNLPTDGIVCLHDAKQRVSDPTLSETLELSIENGYILADVSEDEFYSVQYTLEKCEVDE